MRRPECVIPRTIALWLPHPSGVRTGAATSTITCPANARICTESTSSLPSTRNGSCSPASWCNSEIVMRRIVWRRRPLRVGEERFQGTGHRRSSSADPVESAFAVHRRQTTGASQMPFDPAHAQTLRDRFAEASRRPEISNAAFTASFQSSTHKNSDLGIVEALRECTAPASKVLSRRLCVTSRSYQSGPVADQCPEQVGSDARHDQQLSQSRRSRLTRPNGF
jgi:hypothetical protein